MAGELGNPEIVQEEVDILIIGGGMAACGAAYEIGPWIKASGADIKVKLVDKAACDGCAACVILKLGTGNLGSVAEGQTQIPHKGFGVLPSSISELQQKDAVNGMVLL